jgi:hypothetical protein
MQLLLLAKQVVKQKDPSPTLTAVTAKQEKHPCYCSEGSLQSRDPSVEKQLEREGSAVPPTE